MTHGESRESGSSWAATPHLSGATSSARAPSGRRIRGRHGARGDGSDRGRPMPSRYEPEDGAVGKVWDDGQWQPARAGEGHD